MLQYLLVLAVLAIALYAISQPLLSARRASAIASDDVRALEAARDSKLQEIRDAEMDMRTGKLSMRTTRRSMGRCAQRRCRSWNGSTTRSRMKTPYAPRRPPVTSPWRSKPRPIPPTNG